MHTSQHTKHPLSSGKKSQQGVATLLFIVLFPFLITLLALGVESARYLQSKARMNDGAEQAVLAIAADTSDKDKKTMAQQFLQHFTPDGELNRYDIRLDAIPCQNLGADACSEWDAPFFEHRLSIRSTFASWFPANDMRPGFDEKQVVMAQAKARIMAHVTDEPYELRISFLLDIAPEAGGDMDMTLARVLSHNDAMIRLNMAGHELASGENSNVSFHTNNYVQVAPGVAGVGRMTAFYSAFYPEKQFARISDIVGAFGYSTVDEQHTRQYFYDLYEWTEHDSLYLGGDSIIAVNCFYATKHDSAFFDYDAELDTRYSTPPSKPSQSCGEIDNALEMKHVNFRFLARGCPVRAAKGESFFLEGDSNYPPSLSYYPSVYTHSTPYEDLSSHLIEMATSFDFDLWHCVFSGATSASLNAASEDKDINQVHNDTPYGLYTEGGVLTRPGLLDEAVQLVIEDGGRVQLYHDIVGTLNNLSDEYTTFAKRPEILFIFSGGNSTSLDGPAFKMSVSKTPEPFFTGLTPADYTKIFELGFCDDVRRKFKEKYHNDLMIVAVVSRMSPSSDIAPDLKICADKYLQTEGALSEDHIKYLENILSTGKIINEEETATLFYE